MVDLNVLCIQNHLYGMCTYWGQRGINSLVRIVCLYEHCASKQKRQKFRFCTTYHHPFNQWIMPSLWDHSPESLLFTKKQIWPIKALHLYSHLKQQKSKSHQRTASHQTPHNIFSYIVPEIQSPTNRQDVNLRRRKNPSSPVMLCLEIREIILAPISKDPWHMLMASDDTGAQKCSYSVEKRIRPQERMDWRDWSGLDRLR